MRQGYIDSQGNKYILTGVKAQFPRWTYAEWQAEGEPIMPWIRKDAPSGYRKVSGDDVSYDNTSSELTADNVQEAIDEIGSVSIGTVTKTDTTNVIGSIYTKSIIKMGKLKVLTLVMELKTGSSATLNTWYDLGTVPAEYGAENNTEAFIVSLNGYGLDVIAEKDTNKIRFILRSAVPTNNLLVMGQIVYV